MLQTIQDIHSTVLNTVFVAGNYAAANFAVVDKLTFIILIFAIASWHDKHRAHSEKACRKGKALSVVAASGRDDAANARRLELAHQEHTAADFKRTAGQTILVLDPDFSAQAG